MSHSTQSDKVEESKNEAILEYTFEGILEGIIEGILRGILGEIQGSIQKAIDENIAEDTSKCDTVDKEESRDGDKEESRDGDKEESRDGDDNMRPTLENIIRNAVSRDGGSNVNDIARAFYDGIEHIVRNHGKSKEEQEMENMKFKEKAINNAVSKVLGAEQ